jgi:hypothetical protein
MKTHNQRREWMEEHGWVQEQLPTPCRIKEFGDAYWFEELGEPRRSLWLCVSDGRALLHGAGSQAMMWAELQNWIERREEQKKPLANQKTLFGDDDQ